MEVPSALLRFAMGDLRLLLRGALFRRGYPWGYLPTYGNFDDPGSYEMDRWLSFDLTYTSNLSAVLDLSLRAYGDLYDYRFVSRLAAAEDCLDGQTGGCVYDLLGVSRWTGLEATVDADWLRDGRFVTLLGVDGRMRFYRSRDGFFLDLDHTDPQGRHRYQRLEGALGAYVQQIIHPWPWLTANAGARLDLDQRFGYHVSPRGAVSVSPWPQGTVKIIYAEAFRAPTGYELLYSDFSEQPPAPDLESEGVRSVEAAIEQRLGAQRFMVGAFRSWWLDMVSTVDLTAEEIAAAQARGDLDPSATEAYQYRNLAAVDSYGLHAAFDGGVRRWGLSYGIGATLARARQDLGDGEPLRLAAAAQLFGNARVAWAMGDDLPVLALAARHAGRRPVVDSEFDPTPFAPAQTELRATVSGPLPWLSGLSYRLSANYAFAGRGAYAIGPLVEPTADYARQELVPQRQIEVAVGLQYDFLTAP
jgi:outer membrane receptor protein involved in Fe transport